MSEDEIPLVIRPKREVLATASFRAQDPVEVQSLETRSETRRENASDARLPEQRKGQEQNPVPTDIQQKPVQSTGFNEFAIKAETTGRPDDEIPLVLSPTGEIRRIEDAPTPVRGSDRTPPETSRSISSLLWTSLISIAGLVFVGLWLVQLVMNWATTLSNFHPALAYVLYATVGIILLLVLVQLCGQYRAYVKLEILGGFREALEIARRSHVSKREDEDLRKAFRTRVENLATANAISSKIRRSVLVALERSEPPGAWVDLASARLLQSMDERAKLLIEQESRLVGVTTALSPSAALDSLIVLWRNARLIMRIAEIYGVRPGGYGNYCLVRRVISNMAIAGLSQEVMQMLYAAYGPAAVEAASKGFRGFFDLVSKAGIMWATVEPVTGGILAVGGALGKGTADFAGVTASQMTGPLAQGFLNAILTIRFGLAAQNECRLVCLSQQERRTQSAGIVSALLGFFLSVRRMSGTAQNSVGAECKASPH